MKTHNMSRTRIYHIWNAMICRCTTLTNKHYMDYGGRGITVDPTWRNFVKFYEDMGEAPKGHSLERIDNNKGYSKENCKWATPKEQMNNRRFCVLLTFNGCTQNITQWATTLGISRTLIYDRLRLGWNTEKTLTAPKGRWPK